MTDRFMLDCTHANLHTTEVLAELSKVTMVACYTTGDPTVQWTTLDKAYVVSLGKTLVTIDQGFTGSPDLKANVRDVESSAWSATKAVDKTGWTTPRPTIYAARYDMFDVINAGWKDDIWLSWPLSAIPTKEEVLKAYPKLTQANLIGVQIGFTHQYDTSVVYDPYWPLLPPDPPKGPTVLQVPGWPGNWLAYDFFDTKTATVLAGQGTNGDFYYCYRPHGSTVITGPVHVNTGA